MRNLAIVLILITLPCIADAQSRRAGSWETTFSVIFQDSVGITGEGDSTLDVKSNTGWGINFAYNMTSKLAFGMDFEFLNPKYTATLVDDTGIGNDLIIDHKFSQFNGRFKGVFNIIDGPFTPYIEAGLGWSYFDSNVADGPPDTGCYWHPWWGYICNNYYDTFDTTEFSYGLGAGLRYEFRGGAIIKASYNYWEIDGLGKSDDSGFPSARLELGWRF